MQSGSPLPFTTGFTGGERLNATVPGVPGARDIQIAPDRILDVARIIEEQAGALQEKLAGQLGALRINAPAEDIVSTNVVDVWNEVIAGADGSYERKVRAYVQELRSLAEQLREASGTYQLDDEDKAASFGDRRVHEA
ncbi:hypothetical protein JHE00_10615 [Prauserella sp. ASG 168]|uniref:PE domain-containing protein n=2 Tax=Prauserella cavernicola TaxID=2800127 RepID=A0A934QSW2_9PSEU|nr:hypothetical protein [Prauserella cavernicola]